MSIVLTNTEKATKALLAATAGLGKAQELFVVNAAENDAVLESVAVATNKLAAIAEETDVAVRKAKIDLDLRVQENTDVVLAGILQDRSLTAVDSDEYQVLQNKASNTDYDNTVEITKAVKAATAKVLADAALTATQVQAAHSVESATLKADKIAQANEITFLKRSIETLEANASAEREARVSIAASAAKAEGVTVNTAK